MFVLVLHKVVYCKFRQLNALMNLGNGDIVDVHNQFKNLKGTKNLRKAGKKVSGKGQRKEHWEMIL